MVTMMTGTTGTTDVADVLRHLGVQIKRVGEKEISGCCPVHERVTGKADRSPSWSMNAKTGLWICHSCGSRGTLSSLVSELSGEPDSIIAVHTFLVQSGLDRLTTDPVEEKQPEIDWRLFSQFEAPSDNRLLTRAISRESALKYGIRFSRDKQAWILPMTTAWGELLGWQEKYANKTLNYPTGIKKSETLFGLDKAEDSTGLLVESPLDVARLDTVIDGISGVASFGAHISTKQISLLAEHFDSLIVALDNDEAGINAAKKLQRVLPAFRFGVKWLHYAHTDAKDIGEMTHAHLVQAVTEASVFPWWLHV
jgi:5S rRNA maturation endonuclease (ribonuclease M5)